LNHSTDLDALDRRILDALRSGRSFESHDKERSQYLGFDAATNRFLLKVEEFNANDVTEEILPSEVISTAKSIRCVTIGTEVDAVRIRQLLLKDLGVA
jgi:hypothetical protein